MTISYPSLAEAALLVAKTEYPELDVQRYLHQIEDLAERVRVQLPEEDNDNLHQLIYMLNQVLFEEEGFVGNMADFYDPRNSFLNEVLERKQGIPITLSILYIEVGRRIGLPLEGISFPGHFLVKLSLSNGDIVLDPFSQGVSLSAENLLERLQDIYGDNADLDLLRDALETATPQDIMVRMLRNLKGIYLQRKLYDKALQIMNIIVTLAGDVPEEWRDRGAVYQQLECARAALQDYQKYLQMKPEAEDKERIEEHLFDLRKQAAMLH